MEDIIKSRRTIRGFKGEKLDEAALMKAFDCARYAPSWKNTQPWRYYVIEDRALLTQIAENCTSGFEKNKAIISHAPTLIVLVTVEGLSGCAGDGKFLTNRGSHWQSFDAGIAAQTLCLALHENGIGSVIMGIFDERKIAEAIGIPFEMSVSALIAAGYPASVPAAPERKDVSELVTFIR